MARIRGTNRGDDLTGTADADDIFGAQGDDLLNGGGGGDLIRGGRGNDWIALSDDAGALGFGGNGRDEMWSQLAHLVGGPGDDLLTTDAGDLYGDAGLGTSQRAGGDDGLRTYMSEATGWATQTGGQGADIHFAQFYAEGIGSVVEVKDFTAGQDTLGLGLLYTAGNFLDQNQLWGVLDTNGDGILGNDVPGDANSEVFSDVANNRLIIRIHEDHVILDGITQLAAADYLFF